MLQFSLLLQLLHIPEHRTEIRTAPSLYSDSFQIFLPFFFTGYHGCFLNETVALQDVKFHLFEKILSAAEYPVSFLQKPLYHRAAAGAGRINGNHQFLQFSGICVFQRFQKRKISVPGQSHQVWKIIKTLQVQLQFLSFYRKFSQKSVIIPFSFGLYLIPLLLFSCLTSPPSGTILSL